MTILLHKPYLVKWSTKGFKMSKWFMDEPTQQNSQIWGGGYILVVATEMLTNYLLFLSNSNTCDFSLMFHCL